MKEERTVASRLALIIVYIEREDDGDEAKIAPFIRLDGWRTGLLSRVRVVTHSVESQVAGHVF